MLADDLRRGLSALALELDEQQQRQLIAFVELLVRWNRRFNLTAIRDVNDMLVRHIFDSLAVLPYLAGQRCIDVGTGGGLPGIPLAIADASRSFTLLDSNGKKTRFLTQVKGELSLENVDVVHSRVEAWQPEGGYDVVLSRAFASLDDMIDGCQHLPGSAGVFMAMKGQHPGEEISAIEDRIQDLSIDRLVVPGLDEERCLVRFILKAP